MIRMVTYRSWSKASADKDPFVPGYTVPFSRLTTLTCLVLLAGCARSHPPAPAPHTIAPQAASPVQRLTLEAKWLEQYPGLATRKGHTLTIHFGARTVATYTDDAKGCDPYSISKVVLLYDDASAKRQPVAEVTCHFGTIDNRYLVLPSTDKYVVRDDIVPSPDGHRFATSDNSLGAAGGEFTLVSWPTLARTAAFHAGCRKVEWRDDTHISAICWHNNGVTPHDPNDSRDVYFSADIWRDGNGQWQMQGTHFVQADSSRLVPDKGRTLPRLMAFVPPPDAP